MPTFTPRSKYNAFNTSILRERLLHFAGNSYLQILPGDAEIILVGEYVSDDEAIQLQRDPVSTDISIPVGNDYVLDDFRVAEVDSYVGSYLSLTFTGSMDDGTRRAIFDAAVRTGSQDPGNVRSTVKAVSPSIVSFDEYMTGVNDSPGPSSRNAPGNSTVPANPFGWGGPDLPKIIGGVQIASQSFFRSAIGNFRRKPKIGIAANLSPVSHGQLKDLIKGPVNTKTYDVSRPHGGQFDNAPLLVKFVVSGNVVPPAQTTSQNISPTGIVENPFFDGQAVSRETDELIVTT
jgi:hypothetical protein